MIVLCHVLPVFHTEHICEYVRFLLFQMALQIVSSYLSGYGCYGLVGRHSLIKDQPEAL